MTEATKRFWGVEDRRSFRTLLCLGIAVQLFLILRCHVPSSRVLQGDEKMYHARALEIAAGDFHRPDFAWPPLQIHLLGTLYAFFGDSRLPLELLQGALLIGSALLVRSLTRAAGVGPVGADVAFAFILLDPQLAAFAQYLWPEVAHVFLGLLSLALLTLLEPSVRSSFFSGVSFGVAQLAKLFFKPFAPLFVAIAVLRGGGAWKERGARAAAFVFGILVVVGPVLAFYGTRYGVWTIADTSAHVVWMGLNSVRDTQKFEEISTPAYYEYENSSPDPAVRNRLEWAKVRRKIRTDGLIAILKHQISVQYFRLLDKKSFFVDQLPGERWGPPDEAPTLGTALLKGWAYGAWALLLVGASIGVFQVRKSDLLGPVAVPLLYLAASVAMFFILNSRTRYRLPLLPAMAFFAGLAVDRAREANGRGARLAAGVALGALTLFLAFSEPA